MGLPDGYLVTSALELAVHTCQGCGMTFAVPVSFRDRFDRVQGAKMRCPNPSCAWPSFQRTTSTEEALRRELEEAKAKAKRAHEAREWAEAAAESARRSARATRGHYGRLKRRVGAGVCPCCNRSFQNLQRHMAGQHPGFAASKE